VGEAIENACRQWASTEEEILGNEEKVEREEGGGTPRQLIPVEFYSGLVYSDIPACPLSSPFPQQIDIICCFARLTWEECKASVPLRHRLIGPSTAINCIHPQHTTPKTVYNHKRNSLEDSSYPHS
jgi:hypothetical protein